MIEAMRIQLPPCRRWPFQLALRAGHTKDSRCQAYQVWEAAAPAWLPPEPPAWHRLLQEYICSGRAHGCKMEHVMKEEQTQQAWAQVHKGSRPGQTSRMQTWQKGMVVLMDEPGATCMCP